MRPDTYTKLTDGVMRELIHLQQRCYNISQIASMTGVARKTAADFLNGETHVAWWLAYYKERDGELTPAAEDLEVYINPGFITYAKKDSSGDYLPKLQSLLARIKQKLVGKIQKMIA